MRVWCEDLVYGDLLIGYLLCLLFLIVLKKL